MKATVPTSALPTQLAADNRLTTIYATHVLIPRLGPLAAHGTIRLYARLLRDCAAAVELVLSAQAYQRQHGKPVSIPSTAPSDEADFRFAPVVRGGNAYLRGFVAPLLPFAAARPVAEGVGGAAPVGKGPRGKRAPKVVKARYAGLPGKLLAQGASGRALAQVLHGIAQANVALEELLAMGALGVSGPWLGSRLAEAADAPTAVAALLASRADEAAHARAKAEAPLLDGAASLLLELGVTGSALLERMARQPKVRGDVHLYLAWKLWKLGLLDLGGPSAPSPVPAGRREWAFSRTERLSVGVGTPTLRGPLATDAVAPASELVTSESSLQEAVSFREQGSARSSDRIDESATFTGATFRQALAHMTEEGVNSEGAFSQDTTLFDSLRERRREAIDRTLTRVSSSNEQRAGAVDRSVTSRARSYTTRGKDPRYATTEVAFQVAAPVDVEVRLEGVGLVWCPRLASPFLALQQVIRDFEAQARTEYLAQNQVVDPVRPPEVRERATFRKEVSVAGNARRTMYRFSFEIPAQYRAWDFEESATTVSFRNGTSADYNWDEMWNLDDLENASVWFQELGRIADTVTGRVVLDTTDPEALNRGFATIDFAMSRLTDESRAALEAYEADRQEAAAQRQAVAVRANQYARLRRDELIAQYEASYALQEEAFSRLVKLVFPTQGADLSYWKEILRSAIDWSGAGMRFEPGEMEALAYPQLPPSHFMNALGIRFILPVLRSGEAAFFEALQRAAGTHHAADARAVKGYVDAYRARVEALKTSDPSALVLDSYKSELVLGRHLEAVLSQHPFAEPA